MEMKHIIIFAIIGIVALLGFNIINGSGREESREAMVSNAATETVTTTDAANVASPTNGSTDIASQPLSEQPKAILDDATDKIEQAQQAEQNRLDQTSSTQ